MEISVEAASASGGESAVTKRSFTIRRKSSLTTRSDVMTKVPSFVNRSHIADQRSDKADRVSRLREHAEEIPAEAV